MKLGFCYLTYKSLSQEGVWQEFFKNSNAQRYGLYCHPKDRNKVKQKILKDKIIEKTIPTGWGELNLVEASLNLFEAAINDGCDYVFLLSGSCIPIHSFNYIYKKITDCQKSRIHYVKGGVTHGYFNSNETKRRYDESELIEKYINFEDFIKSEQWIGLCKKDVLLLKDQKEDTLKFFKDIFASDEHYIPTVLNQNGTLDSSENQPITYTNWEDNIDWRHPVKYLRFNDKVLNKAMNSGAFFMRKASRFSNAKSALKKYAKKIIKIPSNKKYIIYIHIPKNGGCSVKKTFQDYGRFFNFSHKTAKEIYGEVGEDLWGESYKVSLIRNPWDRALSAYYFFAVGGLPQFNDQDKADSVGISLDKDFSSWVIENEENFLNKKFPFAGTAVWQHFKKQIQYLDYPIDDIIKLEDLPNKKLNPFKIKLPKENRSNHIHYYEVYSSDAKEIIREAYKEDIKAFRYDFF